MQYRHSKEDNQLPLVSIIVPVYGVENYIEKCACSVFTQTYGNLEIIFVDDCTPDNSINVLRKIMEMYPERKNQVKILRHDYNRGLSAARNTGIDAATGTYIYFLDSDDAITEDCVEILEENISHGDCDFVIGGIKTVGFDRTCVAAKLSAKEGIFVGKEIMRAYGQGQWYMMAWNKLLNRSFVVNNGIYFKEGLIHEDDVWSYKLAAIAKTMSVVHTETYIYYNRPNSIMNTRQQEREVQALKTIIIEDRKTQRDFNLFSYWGNAHIDSVDDMLFNGMLELHNTKRISYHALRELDSRTLQQKWQCYKRNPKVLIKEIHRFLPEYVGRLYYVFFRCLFKFKVRQNV